MTFAPGAFQRAISIDWSSSAVPTTGADSCWLAQGRLDSPGPVRTSNPSTRQQAGELIEGALRLALARGERTLVVIDVSFGFAAGTTEVLGLAGTPAWRALWTSLEARVHDDERNRNDRFEVADQLNESCGTRVFWGRPHQASFDHLANLPIKDVEVPGLAPNPLPRLRLSESLAGPGVISSWMLVGKGSVGGQVLTCLPYLERLRRRLGDAVTVWPFDAAEDPGTPVVLAETWHGLFDWRRESGSC